MKESAGFLSLCFFGRGKWTQESEEKLLADLRASAPYYEKDETMHFKQVPNDHTNHRYSGILLHPTSFPSPYGIGDLGHSAYEFIDFLEAAGQHLWQILPLVPTTFGNSPYQGYSVFAGNAMLISPDLLVEQKLLTKADLEPIPEFEPTRVDFEAVEKYKNGLFRKAFQAFPGTPYKHLLEAFETFCKDNAFWLDQYSLFMAGKDYHGGKGWMDWEASLRDPSPAELKAWEVKLEKEITYYKFLQFLFHTQWTALKKYANTRHIAIIGDLPIFVALDSADVWGNKKLFQLDEKGYPTKVAGVPPDYFSAEGQMWGNPLYDWDAHEADGFSWWIARIRNQLTQVDYLRLDHFRGFEAYWAVPADAPNAISGTWKKGPGEKLFLAVQKALGQDLPLFAEDLGIITPEVEKLRKQFDFPGMRVLQFAYDGDESTFLPHQFDTRNCICYTGTHDNDTSAGWYEHATEFSRDRVRRYMNTDASNISWDFIRTCLGTIAKYAIFPLQDVLSKGSDCRMNVPGTATGNWAWRYETTDLHRDMAEGLKKMTQLFGR